MFSVKNYKPLQGITSYEYDISYTPDSYSISETSNVNSDTSTLAINTSSTSSISNNKPL